MVKPLVSEASNCILPTYVIAAILQNSSNDINGACDAAYNGHVDPATGLPYVPNPGLTNGGVTIPYAGFDPVSPNATNPDFISEVTRARRRTMARASTRI